jgi:O-antigen/teichoic acid export membrane protein
MTARTIPAPGAGDAPEEEVGRRVAAGSALMVIGRLAVRAIGIVSSLILVRLLVPEDFGLVGLAAAAITVAEVLTQAGIGMAVVRHPHADRALYDTAWTLNLLRCLLLGGLLAATATWQAALLGDPRIGPIIMVVALTTALDGLASAGLFRLQRELRFDRIFRYELVARLAAFAATIALAVLLQNYWCLVLGNLIARCITIPYGYWLAPHRARLCFTAWRELLHFSKWMLAANACGAIEGQAANLSIGRLVGLPALGLWQISWQVAAVPVTELAVPIRGPVYAGYARVQSDPGLLRAHFLNGFGLLAMVLTPLSVGIALTAPEVQRLALGAAFAGAAPLIALCALYASIDALAHFTFNLFIVLGEQRRMVTIHVALVLLRVPAVIAGAILGGAEGAGLALVLTGLVGAAAWHGAMARLLGYGLPALWAEAWRSFAAATVMTALLLALRPALPAGHGMMDAAFTLVILVGCGAVAHVGTQTLLWRLAGRPRGAETRAMAWAGHWLGRIRPLPAAPPG